MPKVNFNELFDEPVGNETTYDNSKTVPNIQPRITNVPYRLAVIGEAPGADEVDQGRPFVGYSGKELDRFLSRFGILRDACFVGNVCQHRPAFNKIANFDWDGPEIQGGLRKLRDDLSTFNPNIILCLGGSALHAFMAPDAVPRKRKSKDGLVFALPNSIGDWRGSFFSSHALSPFPNCKAIASYHPAACLRQYEWTPYLMMDIKRAFDEATTKELVLPMRDLNVSLNFHETMKELEKVMTLQGAIGTDIEGYWNNWSCISFAVSPNYAFIVPLTNMRGESYWSLDEEVHIMRAVASILSNPKITKVWQNGLYDRFCTQYGYNIVVRGPSHDTMLKHWELYCEMEKGLGVLGSIYTKEPYYKSERGNADRETFWRYCCKDSCITLEVDQQIDRYMKPESRRHYEFNLTLLNSLLYMELRGIRYNKLLAKQRLIEVEHQIYELQHDLNTIAGVGLTTQDKVLLRVQLRDALCYKRDPSRVKKGKKGNEDNFDLCMRTLLGTGPLSKTDMGRLETILGQSLNTKGAGLKTYLYETLKLPTQYDPITKAVTCDYEALLTLSKKSDHPSIPLIITIGELRTRCQMLGIKTDSDGRVRAGYNEVGSETGRVTCYTSPTGSGYNMQTIPDENELKPEGHPLRAGMRDLLQADEGCYLAKCDLKGADGWTVGANLSALGDSTMLDDLRYGLKPASILCYARRHGVGSITGKTREELATLCKEVQKSDWDYFAYKQCIWGFCYLMGVRKAVQHVFNLSEGAVLVKESDMDQAKAMLFHRYNIKLWHRAMEERLFRQPYPPQLVSPSGHIRKFFGRKQEIVGQALAHEPQSVTTYATNQAVFNCWTDRENRVPEVYKTLRKEGHDPGPDVLGLRTRTRLRVEPMHQVHDEFLVQFRQEDTEWAKVKIKQWFNNPIRIAGVEVTIPYDGAYGTNWSMDTKAKIGSI